MTEPEIAIHFACNDDNGEFAGKSAFVELQVNDEHDLTLETTTVPVRLACGSRTLAVNGKGYAHTGRERWTGNMAWDCWIVSKPAARRIVEQLVGLGWTPAEWHTEGLFNDLLPRKYVDG